MSHFDALLLMVLGVLLVAWCLVRWDAECSVLVGNPVVWVEED